MHITINLTVLSIFITGILSILKLLDFISVSWVWVFMPIWMSILLSFIGALAVMIVKYRDFNW